MVGITHSPDDELVEMEQPQLAQKVKRIWSRGPGAEGEREDFMSRYREDMRVFGSRRLCPRRLRRL